ncbi:hypothetical protein Agub_g9511 [Astrephomene gubernaculifera]|uniref:Uncharacterized protein n=1 Tax=Astrephomene gubernaculifera TaxID=47775 RepID=A0AAD3DXS5_9CHLO|nr:hypothetical protein Agub_g9511 [Astrephomene gubernaculifera]
MDTLQAQASAAFSCGTGEASSDSSGSTPGDNSPALVTPSYTSEAVFRAKSQGPDLGIIATALDFEPDVTEYASDLTHITGDLFDEPALGASVVGCTLAGARHAASVGATTYAPQSNAPSRSPLRCRHVSNVATGPLSKPTTSLPQLPSTGSYSDSVESEHTSLGFSGGNAAYPADYCASPRASSHTPEFLNPLFDGEVFPSPLTQIPSESARDCIAAAKTPFLSPTVHSYSHGLSPSGRPLPHNHDRLGTNSHSHYDHPRQHHHAEEPHRRPQQHQHTSTLSAAVTAALPMLRGLTTRGSAEQAVLVSSLASLANASDDVHLGRIPWRSSGSGRASDPDASRRRAVDCPADAAGASTSGQQLDATLELLRYAASLQQRQEAREKEVAALQSQLQTRNKEVAALQQQLNDACQERDQACAVRDEALAQLDEAFAEREELGLALLDCQAHISELELRLQQEARDKAAMASQSKLLQQQIQESEEAWRDAQKMLHELQKRSQEGQQDYELCSLQAIADYGDVDANGASVSANAAAGSSSSGADDASEPRDPRDTELAKLRRENQSLLQRLIASSLAQAQAREREEAAKHELHMLRDLNQSTMESVNTLSLELSLLRPNACGRAGGRFNLPFLRRSNGASGSSGGGSAS